MTGSSREGDAMARMLNCRYELQYLIGTGEIAEVYVAHDRMLGRSVVVKRLREQLVGDAVANERLRREAFALAQLESPRVVGIHDVGSDGGLSYLVLTRIHGFTLEDEIRRVGPTSAVRACRLAIDMLSGLAAIHARGLVHRDLKPTNVMIDLDDRAVLLDLGIALHRRRHPLTPPGFAAGTPAYMAPEQLEERRIDSRTDLYQVGLLLVYLTTGAEIDRNASEHTLPELPGPLRDVVVRAIAPVAARYPSTAAMMAAVTAVMRSLRANPPPARAEQIWDDDRTSPLHRPLALEATG
jgi:serine/threonine-protein kinase